MGKSFRCRIGGDDTLPERRRSAGLVRKFREHGEIDRAALRMQIKQALCELGHLREPARNRHLGHGMGAQIFEHPANEIAHIDECGLRQAIELLYRCFRTRAGRARDQGMAGGTRDIDAAANGIDPRRAGIGHDNAGGPEDREASDDAEPQVERLLRERFAARDCKLDLDIAAAARRRRDFCDGLAQHRPRHRVDRGLAWRNGKPCARDGAHALSGTKDDACSRAPGAHRRQHQRAMGDIGIIAGILDHTGGCAMRLQARDGKGKRRPLAARQRYLDRIGKFAGKQRRIGGLRGRGGAGSGGPAPAKRTIPRGHGDRYIAPGRCRHHATCTR